MTAKKILADFSKQVKTTLEWSKTENYPFHPEKLLINADEALKAMKEYARLAIVEDRKNLLYHVTCSDNGCVGREGEYFEWWRVDEDSIINAPQIELK